MRKFGIALLSFILLISAVKAQPKHTLDKIAAVIGSGIILQSDIELKYATYVAQGMPPNPGAKCNILQQLVSQKLLALCPGL